MNKNEVMREYDVFERRDVSSLSGLKISEAKITKVVSDDEHGSYISYFCFNENETASSFGGKPCQTARLKCTVRLR